MKIYLSIYEKVMATAPKARKIREQKPHRVEVAGFVAREGRVDVRGDKVSMLVACELIVVTREEAGHRAVRVHARLQAHERHTTVKQELKNSLKLDESSSRG